MGEDNKTAAVANLTAPPLYVVPASQASLCALAALASLLLLDAVAAYSILLGGMICVVPGGYFLWKTFRFRGARNAARIAKSFYAGEAGKLAMTGLLFALVFAGVRPLNELAVIIGFIIAIVAGLAAAAWPGFRSG